MKLLKAFTPIVLFFLSCTNTDMKKGTLCLELGDYERAGVFFEKVLNRNPAHSGARLGMGKALLQKAADLPFDTISWHKALIHLEAAKTLHASEELNHLLSQVWGKRTQALLRACDTLYALEALASAIEYEPDNVELLNLTGILYFRLGKVEKSRAFFLRSVMIDTLNPSPLFNLGMIEWYGNQFNKAHQYWFTALKLSPHDEDILYWFARSEKQIRDNLAANSEGNSH